MQAINNFSFQHNVLKISARRSAFHVHAKRGLSLHRFLFANRRLLQNLPPTTIDFSSFLALATGLLAAADAGLAVALSDTVLGVDDLVDVDVAAPEIFAFLRP